MTYINSVFIPSLLPRMGVDYSEPGPVRSGQAFFCSQLRGEDGASGIALYSKEGSDCLFQALYIEASASLSANNNSAESMFSNLIFR